MNIIDCYYRFEKLDNTKCKTRFELVYYSDIYEPLNNPNNKGEIFIYLGSNPYIKASQTRRSNLTISVRSRHLTSVFIPEIEKPNLAYGDCSQDAILIIISEKTIELLICKGKKNILSVLYNLLYDGELNQEIETFRDQLTAKNKVSAGALKYNEENISLLNR